MMELELEKFPQKCDIGGKISNFRSRKKNMRKIKQRVSKKCWKLKNAM